MKNENTPKNTILSQIRHFIFVHKNSVAQKLEQGQQKSKLCFVSNDRGVNDEKNTNFICKMKKAPQKRPLKRVKALYFTKFFRKIKTENFVKNHSGFYMPNFLRKFLQKIIFIKTENFERINYMRLNAVMRINLVEDYINTHGQQLI